MEKFEKVLSLFIKNPYTNIKLSRKLITNAVKVQYGNFFVLPLFIIFISVFCISIILFKIKSNINFNQFIFIYYIYCVYLTLIPFISILSFKNTYNIRFKTLSYLFFSSINQHLSILGIISIAPISLFIINNIQVTTIYAYYMSFIIIICYYYHYYYYRWKKYILEKHYTKIKKRLEINNYYFNIDDKLFQYDLKEDEKNKPKLTKIAEKVVSFMMKFGFTLPVLATLASSGTGGNGMIYFAIYLMFFIIPEIMKLITKQSALYSIFKQIEKEEGMTIYNGRLKIDNNEKNKI